MLSFTPKSFNADAISSLHFLKTNVGRKPVFWILRNYVVSHSRIAIGAVVVRVPLYLGHR